MKKRSRSFGVTCSYLKASVGMYHVCDYPYYSYLGGNEQEIKDMIFDMSGLVQMATFMDIPWTFLGLFE